MANLKGKRENAIAIGSLVMKEIAENQRHLNMSVS